MPHPSLADLIGLGPTDMVALIGGGGKTTTLLALAETIRERGDRVLVTTTTRIWPPDQLPLLRVQDLQSSIATVRDGLSRHGVVVVGRELNPEGKLLGVDAADLCRLVAGLDAMVVLCEADGSAGRPLKAHADHEPVVPPCTRVLLVLAGLDAVGQAIEKTVHRPAIFAERFGLALDSAIEPIHLAHGLLSAAEHAPADSRTVFLLSKADGARRVDSARRVRDELTRSRPDATVLAIRRGEAVDLEATSAA